MLHATHRFAFVTLLFYTKQQYYCCTPDTTANTTVGRCVGAWCCCMVHVRGYGVRYFFSEAACDGSIAAFDTLDTAGAEFIAVLLYVVSEILRVLGVWSVRALKAQILRVPGLWWLVQHPEYNTQYPQYKHPKWLEYSEYQECLTRIYFEWTYTLELLPVLFKYSSSPPESNLVQLPFMGPSVHSECCLQ